MSAKDAGPGKLAAATSRKGALKRADGEPLTRQDLQYEVLSYIFNDTHAVFTDPFSDPPGKTVTFRDLYVSAIARAPKTARSVRDKFSESDVFATDFAMLSLLANVGRVNTSMAFFPETRTALRTYHPVPALQRSDGNLTDAPRIRNALKSVILPYESKHVPNSPFAILAQRDTGPIPTTSVVNLLFVLTQHTNNVSASHFSNSGLDFTDLFQPVLVPSAERGRAFLWLVFHYLESSSSLNPYADPAPDTDGEGEQKPDVAPRMHRVDPSALVNENIDTEEEQEYGARMTEQRRQFIATDRARQEAVSAADAHALARMSEGGTPGPALSSTGTGNPATKPKGKLGRKTGDNSSTPADGYMKISKYKTHETLSHPQKPGMQLQQDGSLALAPSESSYAHHRNYNNNQAAPTPASVPAHVSGRGRKHKRGMQTEPYEFGYAPPSPERTMFQQAWHLIHTRDVLADSDEEIGDEHDRLDYTRRLHTLNRLRPSSPSPLQTPEPEPEPELLVNGSTANNTNAKFYGPESEYQQLQPRGMDVDEKW